MVMMVCCWVLLIVHINMYNAWRGEYAGDQCVEVGEIR